MAELNDWLALSFYRDWDYFTSMAESLRLYLFKYHTIPQWNFMLCGGKPELANPQSWAFTWPSLFVYLLPPNAAMICLWLVMTAVGVTSSFAVFRRFGADKVGAAVGAVLYAVNGFFATRFAVGQVTFAFLHLVPLMMIAFISLSDNLTRGEPCAKPFLLAVGAAFLFFSAALPHALFYFFLAFIIVMIARRVPPAAFGALFLGILLAGYKLYPIIAWQIHSPRAGVIGEELTLADVFADFLRFDTAFDSVMGMSFAHQAWFPWEYNAFIGWTSIALLAVAGFVFRRRPKPALFLIGIASILLGLNLSLGNDNPLSLAQIFRHLPLVEGVRVFSRFQVLVIFGVASLVSLAVTPCINEIVRPENRRFARWVVPLLTVAPGIIQTVTLVGAVRGMSSEAFAKEYQLPNAGDVPMLARQVGGMDRGRTEQTFLLNAGYWTANCYEPLKVVRAKMEASTPSPITEPPASRLVSMDADGMELAFNAPPAGPVRILLAGGETSTYDEIRKTLTIRHHLDEPTIGYAISCAGLLLLMLSVIGIWRKESSSRRR